MLKKIKKVFKGMFKRILCVLSCLLLAAPSLPVLAAEASSLEYLISQDHLKIVYRQWPMAHAKGSVVIVHGLKDHSGRYQEFAQRLNAAGYSAYALDLRGHGQSDGPRQRVADFNDYLRDLQRLVMLVQAREANRPVFLFGHSMGGAIVTQYALTFDQPLAGLILSAPAIKEDANVSPALIAALQGLAQHFPAMPALHLEFKDFTRNSQVLQDLQQDTLIAKGDVSAQLGAELLSTLLSIQKGLHRLEHPFLVLHGTADKLTNIAGSQMLFDKAQSPRKEFKQYPGLYHILLNEPEKETVYADIFAWLAEQERLGPVPHGH